MSSQQGTWKKGKHFIQKGHVTSPESRSSPRGLWKSTWPELLVKGYTREEERSWSSGQNSVTDYPEVLKGIITTAVCGHNMLVTPLQVIHTNSARWHGYKMRKGVLLPLKRKEIPTCEYPKWTLRLLCSVKKPVRKGQHMFPLTWDSEAVRFRDRTQTSGRKKKSICLMDRGF